jgi:hypothetical protein
LLSSGGELDDEKCEKVCESYFDCMKDAYDPVFVSVFAVGSCEWFQKVLKECDQQDDLK